MEFQKFEDKLFDERHLNYDLVSVKICIFFQMQHQNNLEIDIYAVVSQIMIRTLFRENFARPLSRGETNYLFINLEDAKISGHRQKEALHKVRSLLTDTLHNKDVVQKAIDESRTLGVWLGSRASRYYS